MGSEGLNVSQHVVHIKCFHILNWLIGNNKLTSFRLIQIFNSQRCTVWWCPQQKPTTGNNFRLLMVLLHDGMFNRNIILLHLNIWGWDSAVGIATGYVLDGPDIESRCGRDFPHTSRSALGLTQPLIQWVLGFSRSKAAGSWGWPGTTSSAEVEGRVEVYICSPSGS